jgi:hypothetical protein
MSKARDLANAGTALTTVSATELGYLDGVTSAVQTQINSKIGSASAINPTIVDAKGDIIAASAADTVARLAVGTNGQVLTAASGEATGLQWSTPAAGGMTLISTTTLTGASVTLSSIPSGYNDLYLVVQNYRPATDNIHLRMRFNSDANADRHNGNTTYQQLGAGFSSTSFQVTPNNDNTVATNLTTITVPNYLNTSTWKMAFSYSMCVNSTTDTSVIADNFRGVYNQTGAITSLVFFPASGNFTSGTVLLYGVK